MSHGHHHIIPFQTLTKVFGGLVALTILTVITARIDFGALNFLHVPIAIGIAVIKTMMVVLYFMALKYDNRVNGLTFGIGTIFVIVFIVITLFDTAFRGDLGNVDPETIMDRQRQEEVLQSREPAPETQRVAPGDFPAEDGEDAPAAAEDGSEASEP